MVSMVSSIFLMFALQHSALSVEQKEQSWMNTELDKHSHKPSETYANLALEGYKKKLGTPSEHITLIEKSLFKNPYRLSLYKLRSRILTEQSSSGFEIPIHLHVLTALKPLFTFIIFVIFLAFSARFCGRLYNHKINFTQPEENLGFYTLSLSLGSILFFSLFLWHYSKIHQPWACVVSNSATVYSGLSENSTRVRSLPSGSCLPIKKKVDKWAGVSTPRASGWIELKHLEPVRGH